MSAIRRVPFAVWAVGAIGAAAIATCAKAPLTAPSGTTIYLQANPDFVPANGGQALVTALLTEPAGTPVADGTEVFFLTTLGSIPESAKTSNGMARAYFVSDSRSGRATVLAYSGGQAAVAPSPTASPSPAAVFRSSGAVGAVTPRPFADATGSGTGQATITIDIGSSLPAKVVVTANPQLLAGDRSATIAANVYDGNGNPVQNVPVIFTVSTTGGDPLQEYLASGGTPQFTNTNGQAFDVLTTRAPNGTTQKTVTVTATTPNGTTNDVAVIVNYTPAS
ncbi:MAG TPA: hypothetical protein VMT70_22290 [Vicinamibacteria bacterium]|nr:hypothetical protein [Vicinamibacteria bacterium]